MLMQLQENEGMTSGVCVRGGGGGRGGGQEGHINSMVYEKCAILLCMLIRYSEYLNI